MVETLTTMKFNDLIVSDKVAVLQLLVCNYS